MAKEKVEKKQPKATYDNSKFDEKVEWDTSVKTTKVEMVKKVEPTRPNLFYYVLGDEKVAKLLIPFMEISDQKILRYLFGENYDEPCKEGVHGISMGTFLRRTLPNLRKMIVEYNNTNKLPEVKEIEKPKTLKKIPISKLKENKNKEIKPKEIKPRKRVPKKTGYKNDASVVSYKIEPETKEITKGNLYSYLPDKDKNIIMLVCTTLKERHRKILELLFGAYYNSLPWATKSYYLELQELKRDIIPEVILRYDYFIKTSKLNYSSENRKSFVNKTIYQIFDAYSKTEINSVLQTITNPNYIRVLKLKFGNNYDIATDYILSQKDYYVFKTIIYKIETELARRKEREKGIGHLNLKTFLNIDKKDVFNIYMYFLDYEESLVTKAIELLSKSDLAKLNLRYGLDLKNPVLNDHITVLEYYEIVCTILPRIEANILVLISKKESKRDNTSKARGIRKYFYDYFIRNISIEKFAIFFETVPEKKKKFIYEAYDEDLKLKSDFVLTKDYQRRLKSLCAFFRKKMKEDINKFVIHRNSTTLKEYFYDYDIEEVLKIIAELGLSRQALLKEAYGEDYLGTLNPNLSKENKNRLLSSIFVSMKKRLECAKNNVPYINKRCTSDVREYYDYFIPKETDDRSKVEEAFNLLTPKYQEEIFIYFNRDFTPKEEMIGIAKSQTFFNATQSLTNIIKNNGKRLRTPNSTRKIKVVKITKASEKLLNLLYYAIASKEESQEQEFDMTEIEKIFKLFSKPVFMEAMRDLTVSECVACAHSLGYISGTKAEICEFLAIDDEKLDNLIASTMDAFKEALNRIIEDVELTDEKGESFKLKLF